MAATPLRDIPDDVLAHYTRQAALEGISRNALLVRVLSDQAGTGRRSPTTVEDLRRSAERCQDLLDPEVMAGAWS